MGKNKINIALLGLGRIGQMHAFNIVNHPEFNLKYTFDIDKSLRTKLSKKYNSININSPNIAFKDKSINCIFIACSKYSLVSIDSFNFASNSIIFNIVF